MKRHYIRIGRQYYRVCINQDTVKAWEDLTKMKIQQFDNSEVRAKQGDTFGRELMMSWLYCALVEGELLDGREFPFSLDGLKMMVKPSILSDFNPLFDSDYIEDILPNIEKITGVQKESQIVNPELTMSRLRSAFRSFFRFRWFYISATALIISAIISNT